MNEEDWGVDTCRWGCWCFDSQEGFAKQTDAAIDRAMKAEAEGEK